MGISVTYHDSGVLDLHGSFFSYHPWYTHGAKLPVTLSFQSSLELGKCRFEWSVESPIISLVLFRLVINVQPNRVLLHTVDG